MIKIRKNVFETNSSSMHSLAIDIFATESRYTPDEILDDLRMHSSSAPDESTIFVDDSHKQIIIFTGIPGEEFSYDWGYDVYSDFTNKFIYALANLGRYPLDLSLFTAQLSKLIGYDIIIKESKKGNGSGSVAFIDHQSAGDLPSYIENAGTSFIDFVLDKNIYLVIDTDNK